MDALIIFFHPCIKTIGMFLLHIFLAWYDFLLDLSILEQIFILVKRFRSLRLSLIFIFGHILIWTATQVYVANSLLKYTISYKQNYKCDWFLLFSTNLLNLWLCLGFMFMFVIIQMFFVEKSIQNIHKYK